jgi:beta-lactamase regulating signal transducer with metallopeptidase domain
MNHILEATAWTLIHFCWQAAVIAGAFRIVIAAFARRSSHVRYALALSALLAMLAAAIFTFAWQMRSAGPSPAFATTASGMANALVSGDFPRSMAPGIASTSRTTTPGSWFANSLPSLMGWIDAFWVMGVLGLAVRGVGGWWLIHRLRVSATTEASDAVLASFQRICNALGLHKQVLLRVSSAIAGPVTVGALRAIVLLPVSAVTLLGPDEIEVVLAHELAHVRRADFVWNLAQTLIETLFFFHPAVWWVSGRVRHERELCCDDLALKVCPNPVVYASALFHLEEQRSRQISLAMALDGHQSPQTLRMRIARILGESMPLNANRSLRPFSAAAVLAAVVVLLIPAPHVIASLRPTPSPDPVVTVAQAPSLEALPAIPALTAHGAVSVPRPAPSPAPVAPRVTIEMERIAKAETQSESPATQAAGRTPGKGSYIDRMKAAGYDVDLDKMIAMKIQNVTPEYAHEMNQLGFGKLSADDLIACKIHGVSPEAIAEFKKQGFEVKSIQDAVSYRIFEVTPQFAEAMKAAGFKDLDSKKLVALRVQGVTPEYASSIAQQYPGATVDDVIKTRIFKIDADFIAQAKKYGFKDLSLEKLVKLRISGVLDDESVKP